MGETNLSKSSDIKYSKSGFEKPQRKPRKTENRKTMDWQLTRNLEILFKCSISAKRDQINDAILKKKPLTTEYPGNEVLKLMRMQPEFEDKVKNSLKADALRQQF